MGLVDKNLYNESSIESLDPREFTRLKPGVYCGNTSYSTQLLVEIVSNSIDEVRLSHGNKIEVSVNDKNVIKVRDYGQGFITEAWRDDGKTVLEAAFSVLNTSGKYRDDGVYEGSSLGSFGIGSKLTNFLSHWLNVTTYRDGRMESCHFVEGLFHSRVCDKSNQPTGTSVEWLPSEEFFDNVEIDVSYIKSLFKTLVCLCPHLTIEFDYKGDKVTYYSANGINDLIDDYVKGKEIINNRFSLSNSDGKYKVDMVMTYTTNYSPTIVPYVNTGLTEGGPHITQIKTLLTREFNKFFRDKKWLKEKDENLSGEDCQEGLCLVFNLTAPDVSYNAQVKTTVVKLDMKPFNAMISEELRYWLEANEKDIKAICDKALSARKAREAARKAREAVRQPKEKKKQLLNLPTKLVDCWGKDRSKCELLISEGDSAAGGLVEARDGETQAVFPIRGKLINLHKATDQKAFANAEVVNIMKALGLEFDTRQHKLIYDEKKLRYGKVLLCADADPDGQAIKNLLLTYFWNICPELLINGHIYVAIPPLFRITTKKNQYIYLRDAAALEEYKSQHLGEKFQVNRNKG